MLLLCLNIPAQEADSGIRLETLECDSILFSSFITNSISRLYCKCADKFCFNKRRGALFFTETAINGSPNIRIMVETGVLYYVIIDI